VLLEPDGTIKHNCKKRVLHATLFIFELANWNHYWYHDMIS
jgi:hypothetical protein